MQYLPRKYCYWNNQPFCNSMSSHLSRSLTHPFTRNKMTDRGFHIGFLHKPPLVWIYDCYRILRNVLCWWCNIITNTKYITYIYGKKALVSICEIQYINNQGVIQKTNHAKKPMLPIFPRIFCPLFYFMYLANRNDKMHIKHVHFLLYWSFFACKV